MTVDWTKAKRTARRLAGANIPSLLKKTERSRTTELISCEQCRGTNIEDENNELIQWCPGDNNYLLVLRRWNSYTPALRTSDGDSLGGGYFLSWQGKGVVIDPGFHFIENFQRAGLKLACIHAIIITHSHLDHYADFEPLLTLLHEYNKIRHDEENGHQPRQITICAAPGVLKKCAGWLDMKTHTFIDSERKTQIFRICSLDSWTVEAGFKLPEIAIKLRPTFAKHHEIIADGYTTGLVMDLLSDEENYDPITIGFTSDTGWHEDIQYQYRDCDLLVIHIGSVKESELGPIDFELYSNHLGALGSSLFLSDEKAPCQMYLFSEFGEEFIGNRRLIMETIKSTSSKTKDKCVVSDIGTRVNLPAIKLACEYTGCENEAEIRDVYLANGVVKHFCRKHQPFTTLRTLFPCTITDEAASV